MTHGVTMNKHDYRPVSCQQHSKYELAIMHKQRLSIRWQDENGALHTEMLLPIDVKTENGAEYLLLKRQPDDEQIKLRLDKITALNHRDEG